MKLHVIEGRQHHDAAIVSREFVGDGRPFVATPRTAFPPTRAGALNWVNLAVEELTRRRMQTRAILLSRGLTPTSK
jgi:hypothetical protein